MNQQLKRECDETEDRFINHLEDCQSCHPTYTETNGLCSQGRTLLGAKESAEERWFQALRD